jgi:hypothetical protein
MMILQSLKGPDFVEKHKALSELTNQLCDSKKPSDKAFTKTLDSLTALQNLTNQTVQGTLFKCNFEIMSTQLKKLKELTNKKETSKPAEAIRLTNVKSTQSLLTKTLQNIFTVYARARPYAAPVSKHSSLVNSFLERVGSNFFTKTHELLVEFDIKIDRVRINENDKTFMQLSIEDADEPTVKFLLAEGADPNYCRVGIPPLFLACLNLADMNFPLVKLEQATRLSLMQAGLIDTIEPSTAFKNIISLLVKSGARATLLNTAKVTNGQFERIAGVLIENRNIDVFDKNVLLGDLLERASAEGDAKKVDSLLTQGAPVHTGVIGKAGNVEIRKQLQSYYESQMGPINLALEKEQVLLPFARPLLKIISEFIQ